MTIGGAAVSRLATSTSLVNAVRTPAFMPARVFAADGAGVAAYVPKGAARPSWIQLLLLCLPELHARLALARVGSEM